MNHAVNEQARQIGERVAAEQVGMADAIQRVSRAFEETSRVVTAYTDLAVNLQRDFMAAFSEQGAALQALADLAAFCALEGSPHLTCGGDQ